ncbi:putative ATP-dependent helicase C23E6,02 [Talaromyces islandicus]|uniref:Putative ATP-dependent helicase C23E6,02 n=1 Tax=Talaromyces islandicus TaxID=28573 RepID=A0A0U1LZG8_TALIS|nr:putative ATP-dependent helicase C23E6,02 [Talaromyces islandicus]
MGSNKGPAKQVVVSGPSNPRNKRPRSATPSETTSNKKPKDGENQGGSSGTRKSERNQEALEKASQDSTTTTAKRQIVGENLSKGVKALREQLHLEDEDDWKAWLRGPFFKPYWNLLWDSWLKHNRATPGKQGLGLDEVLEIKNQYQQDFIGYPDTSDWGEGQYFAHFMYNVVQRNKMHRDGLFANRTISTRQTENLIWAVLKTIQHLHAPSQINRRRGGLALMNGTQSSTNSSSQLATNTPRARKGKAPVRPSNNDEDVSADTEEDDAEAFTLTQPGLSESDIALATELSEFMATSLQESWKDMIPASDDARMPPKISENFNPNEPYWQLMFCRTACRLAQEDIEADDNALASNDTEVDMQTENENPKVDTESESEKNLEDDSDEEPLLSGGGESDWEDDDVDVVQEVEEDGLPNQESLEEEENNLYQSLDHLTADEFAWSESYPETSPEEVSPSHLIRVIPEKLKQYQRELEWLDDYSYQPKDWEKAVASLCLTTPQPDTKSLVRTRHRLMKANTRLEPWQVLGVARLLEMREAKRNSSMSMQRGAFLADVMGLGKTYEAIAYMLEISQRQKNLHNAWKEAHDKDPAAGPPPVHKPFLLIVPSAILPQWCKEIQAITNQLHVKILFGDKRVNKLSTWKDAQLITKSLTKSHELFDGSLERASTVVVTTYETFRNRHGPPAANAWVHKQRKRLGDPKAFSNRPKDVKPKDWPGDLAGLFFDVILDEGHYIRNKDSAISIAVQWSEASFYLIMTATILFNSIYDFLGYVPLILPEDSDSEWNDDNLKNLDVTPSCDPFSLPEDHPAACLMLTHRILQRKILTNKVTITVASVYIKKLLSQLMVRRTLSSIIEINNQRVVIGARILPSHTVMVNVAFSRKEKRLYDRLCLPHYRKLIFEIEDNKFAINMAKLRMLTLLTSYLGFEYCEQLVTSKNLLEVLKLFKLNTLCQSLAETVGNNEYIRLPKKWIKKARIKGKRRSPDINAARTLLRGSPKLRAMFPLVAYNVLVRGKKQLIWCNFPANQIHIAAILRECGVKASIFHAKLTMKEREQLIREFTSEGGCMVLIISVAVNCFGLNLHGMCNEMHFYDIPMTKALLEQAIGRLRRFGQLWVVIVHIYVVKESWNMRQLAKADEKAMASVICDLNMNIFNMRVLVRLGEGEKPGDDDVTDDQAILHAIQSQLIEQIGEAADQDAL